MVNNKDFDYLKMFYDIRNVCLTEDRCGKCKEGDCLVGYARLCIGEAKRKETDTLKGHFIKVPSYDINGGYDNHSALEAIAHTLQQCKSCKDNHTPDCLVNIVRTCYEVIALGDSQPYAGSAFSYLVKLSEKNPEAAAFITEIYKTHTNPMEEQL